MNKVSDLTKIPDSPGCYIFKDAKGTILYIGKAKSLKKRVKSYFSGRKHDTKTDIMVSQIADVDFIVTDNEVEALILENSIIKKNQPKYNIDLKDSKNFAYIMITREKFPRITIARKKEEDADYFGPFVSGTSRNILLQMVKKIFKIRSCKKMPKRACMRYQIDLCSGPCIEAVSEEEYSRQVRLAKMFLSGKSGDLIRGFTDEMKNASADMNYELALEIRKKIEAIDFLSRKQKMVREKKYNEDLINFLIRDGKVYLMLFNIYKGILENKREWVFDYKDTFFDEFLVQFYSENPIPSELITDKMPEVSIIDFLEKIKEKKVRITIPKKGEKRELLSFVRRNIEINNFGDIKKVEELGRVLNLTESPVVIECFDISHLSGTHTVGSMVSFRNGIPDKSGYRRFLIKSVKGIDDFAGIEEVVFRRYKRVKDEHRSFPDLIVIDGGAGQLSAALKSLKKLDVKIPVISLAKKDEEIYIPGRFSPMKLNRKNIGLQLLMKIRDEAHRFAINYNRLLRRKNFL